MDGLNDATKSNLQKTIGTIAPLLVSALSGNAAGVIVALLAHAFGMGDGSVSDLVAKIHTDPEAVFRLRKLETDHAEFLAGLDSKNLEAESVDRQDARKYSAEYKAFLIQMSFIVTGGFFCVLLLLFVPWDVSEQGKNLLSMLVGMLASKWQTIIDFFFGSSHAHENIKLK